MISKHLLLVIILCLCLSGAVAAQESTPTPTLTATPTETPTATPLPTITLTMFLDSDSLTLLIPFSPETVNFTDVTLQVTQSNGQPIVSRLDRDFTAFLGLPFGNMNVLGSICLRLVRSGTTRPVPIRCMNTRLLPQQVTDADVFWFDSSSNVPRVVTMLQNGAFVGLCSANQNPCEIVMTLLPITPTPTPSMTPTSVAQTPSLTFTPISVPVQASATPAPKYPCQGTVINPDSSANIITFLFLEASETSQRGQAMRVGTPITIQRELTDNFGRDWYLIYDGTRRLGWGLTRYISPSTDCNLG